MIGPFLQLRPPRTADAVARVRREVAAWASGTGVDATGVDDLVLVVGELATNAVRHGSGPRFEVVVARFGDHIHLCVHDDGPTDRASNGGEGGRGLAIVRALGGELTLRHGADGTTARVRLAIPPEASPPADAATLPRVPGP